MIYVVLVEDGKKESDLLLAQVALNGGFHLGRIEPALLGDNGAVRADQVGDVRRRAVGAPDRVVVLVHQVGRGDVLSSNRQAGQFHPFFVGWRLADRVAVLVGAEILGPLSVGVGADRPGRVRFDDVNDDELDSVPVPGMELIEGGAPPPEGRSGE